MERSLAPLLALCAECPALTLSTVSAEGAPASAAVFYAFTPELTLYFISEAHTVHSQNLGRNPAASITIYPSVWNWSEIRGLQMNGLAQVIADPSERRRAGLLYRKRFPFVNSLAEALARAQFYKFTPRWARLTDNRVHFAFKQEWNF